MRFYVWLNHENVLQIIGYLAVATETLRKTRHFVLLQLWFACFFRFVTWNILFLIISHRSPKQDDQARRIQCPVTRSCCDIDDVSSGDAQSSGWRHNGRDGRGRAEGDQEIRGYGHREYVNLQTILKRLVIIENVIPVWLYDQQSSNLFDILYLQHVNQMDSSCNMKCYLIFEIIVQILYPRYLSLMYTFLFWPWCFYIALGSITIVDEFLGIPYAEPPVGDLRFKVSSLS